MIGVILGARLVHVLFWEPAYYLANPLEILAIWRGGLAFHGGLVGVIIGVGYFCKKNNVSIAKVADTLTIPAVFALGLGRIANFINGELWGTVTNVEWCVYFPEAEGCRHPVQIYSALKRWIIGGILLLLARKEHKDGFIFWMFVTLFGIGRFFIDFIREDTLYFGLSMGQIWSLGMVLVGLYVLWTYYKSDLGVKKKEII